MDTKPISAEGRRGRTKAQNRETILAAARQVFGEIGFAAATVRDVIRATPLASGTFYNYFKSKEEVYQALRDDVALAVRPRLRAERLAAATARDFLAASFRGFFEAAVAHRSARPDGAAYFRMDTPQVAAGFAELREDIESAMAQGILPPADPGQLTATLVGVAFELARDLKAEDIGSAGAFATTLFLGGLPALQQSQQSNVS